VNAPPSSLRYLVPHVDRHKVKCELDVVSETVVYPDGTEVLLADAGEWPVRARPSRPLGRPKKDPLRGGFNDMSGFWQPTLDAIGRELRKRGAVTEQRWTEFSGNDGPWVILKSFACDSAFLADRKWQAWLCNMIGREPVLIPLFLGMMRERVQSMSHVELWLFYNLRRSESKDAELAANYEQETGRKCSIRQMTRARENIYRRVSRHRERRGVSRKR
jgi:hypothetical protein